ncbi:hypothetical protein G7085_15175 [Tessaracoccus sp. HDW20]|uniref:hypothetical protein n=1 Tax=Tessaracoccus coleopterorum TaxID=2714950 RepID=UPI0018D33AF5|nr:hypothetical protein [Tessaracoccus coleopterorum]NHB85502.1 hypothetical protein [Tessaracoccus coleopterorum]
MEEGRLKASWIGADGAAPSVFFVPETRPVTVLRDGAEVESRREGAWISVAPGDGRFELSTGR